MLLPLCARLERRRYINEPSLMDVAHDTINSTQGPALIEVAYFPKDIDYIPDLKQNILSLGQAI